MLNHRSALWLTRFSLSSWKLFAFFLFISALIHLPYARAGDAKAQREAHAQRWRLDLAGDAKVHAAKLAAFDFKLGFLDEKKNFLVIKA